jgi:hypothetical protein
MIKYTKINTVLPLIANAVRKEDSTGQLLSYILDGYRQLAIPSQQLQEHITFVEIVNHKAVLPQDVEILNLVTYQANDPTDSQWDSFCNSLNLQSGISQEEYELLDDVTNPCAGNYSLAHKLVLNSAYFQECYYPLKYIGNQTFGCKDCLNRYCHSCNETFSVDPNGIIWTSIKEGYLCLIYMRQAVDDLGDYLIVDHPHIKRYLKYFAEHAHFENRFYTHEQGGSNPLSHTINQMNQYYNKARGTMLMKGIDKTLHQEMFIKNYNSKLLTVIPEAWKKVVNYYGAP